MNHITPHLNATMERLQAQRKTYKILVNGESIAFQQNEKEEMFDAEYQLTIQALPAELEILENILERAINIGDETFFNYQIIEL